MTTDQASAMPDDIPCPSCGRDIPVYFEAPEDCLHCGSQLEVLDGAYRVEGLLGRGGQGVVYAGRRVADGEPVAIKMLTLSDSDDWKSTELFERSARVLRGLDHPGVPKVYTFEEDEERGAFMLVRERFDGGTLEERVRDLRRIDTRQYHALLTRMLRILHHLHTLIPPVLHRDIKPSNIMFRSEEDWDPVLVDFGAVADVASSGSTVVGTPGYSAPEQFIGDYGPSSDLYALGVTMLFVATHCEPGELPRRDGEFDVDDRLSGLGERSRSVLLKLIRSNRNERYASASEALADLEPRAAARSTSSGRSFRVREPDRSEPPSSSGTDLVPRGETGLKRITPRASGLERIKREGWIKQVPRSARNWARIGFLVFFFSMMPISLFLTIGYFIWRRSDDDEDDD